MKIIKKGTKQYRLPNHLNEFQERMYIHLINWKWEHITTAPGTSRGEYYDAILPDSLADKLTLIYPTVAEDFRKHLKAFPFKIHPHFNHMASSQAACVNLFLPVLLDEHAAAVLKQIKPDFDRLATDRLDRGFRLEFWDSTSDKGLLGDHCARSGTDADIAIAYYNRDGMLCLWLIEHKLTEAEFTQCNAYKSRGRTKLHNCDKSVSEIISNKDTCYYHNVRRFKYWDITEKHCDFYPGHAVYSDCPFKGGLNQLWRNQLIAQSLEQCSELGYQKTCFSVVRHPENTSLDDSIEKYKKLINYNPKFSVFTSDKIVEAARNIKDVDLDTWIHWYTQLYNIKSV